jgi:hypothetical protein
MLFLPVFLHFHGMELDRGKFVKKIYVGGTFVRNDGEHIDISDFGFTIIGHVNSRTASIFSFIFLGFFKMHV